MATVTLLCNDGEQIELDERCVEQCQYIVNMLEDIEDVDQIPLRNVDSETMRLVKIWLVYYTEEGANRLPLDFASGPAGNAQMDDWNTRFFDKFTTDQFISFILCANYIDSSPLLEIGCRNFGRRLQRKTRREIARMFGREDENDVTDEEREEALKICEFLE